eukprot:361625-Chlamydomonas_euryale.AAC.2
MRGQAASGKRCGGGGRLEGKGRTAAEHGHKPRQRSLSRHARGKKPVGKVWATHSTYRALILFARLGPCAFAWVAGQVTRQRQLLGGAIVQLLQRHNQLVRHVLASALARPAAATAAREEIKDVRHATAGATAAHALLQSLLAILRRMRCARQGSVRF